MPFTYRVNHSVTIDGRVEQSSVTISGGAGAPLNETIPANADDREIAWGLPLTDCHYLRIQASVDLLIKFNDDSSPEAVLLLEAGETFEWHSLAHLPLSIDGTYLLSELTESAIERIYVTNVNGEAIGTLKADALYDPTPQDDLDSLSE